MKNDGLKPFAMWPAAKSPPSGRQETLPIAFLLPAKAVSWRPRPIAKEFTPSFFHQPRIVRTESDTNSPAFSIAESAAEEYHLCRPNHSKENAHADCFRSLTVRQRDRIVCR